MVTPHAWKIWKYLQKNFHFKVSSRFLGTKNEIQLFWSIEFKKYCQIYNAHTSKSKLQKKQN